MLEVAMPLPRLETTPPVMKMYFRSMARPPSRDCIVAPAAAGPGGRGLARVGRHGCITWTQTTASGPASCRKAVLSMSTDHPRSARAGSPSAVAAPSRRVVRRGRAWLLLLLLAACVLDPPPLPPDDDDDDEEEVPPTMPVVDIAVAGTKSFRLQWTGGEGAEELDVKRVDAGEPADVASGLPATATQFEFEAFLPAVAGAEFVVEACNGAGCTASGPAVVMAQMVLDAIGYVKD